MLYSNRLNMYQSRGDVTLLAHIAFCSQTRAHQQQKHRQTAPNAHQAVYQLATVHYMCRCDAWMAPPPTGSASMSASAAAAPCVGHQAR